MNLTLRVGRSLLAVVAGYVAMVLLITLVQEGIFGGVSFRKSSLVTLAIAGGLTFASAVVGGAIAAFIAGWKPFEHGLAMCGIVVIETSVLIATGKLADPLWFDLSASASLLVGILLGTLPFVARARQQALATPSLGV